MARLFPDIKRGSDPVMTYVHTRNTGVCSDGTYPYDKGRQMESLHPLGIPL